MTNRNMQLAIDAFEKAHRIADPLALEAFLQDLGKESGWLREEVESLLERKTPAVEGEGSSSRDKPTPAAHTGYPTIPNCRITEELGSGGFGTVYRALRGAQELAPVAVKVLQSGRDSRSIIERFQRERELHAQMDNQFVARLIDVGTTGEGEPYLMMELVEGGQTILKYAEEQKLTIQERLTLFKKLCEGIEHLHLNGVYHRDLKPSNILVSVVDGQASPKVIDFGLAKADNREELTQEGARIGTRGYMSPEQEAGERLDLRTDVYSLGVLLHELLTGIRPSLARSSDEGLALPSSRVSSSEQLSEVLTERRLQHARQLSRTLKGDLDTIILKAMQFDRRDRYQSANELRSDIGRYEDHEPVLARGKSGLYTLVRLAARHRVASAIALGGVLALAVGVTVAFQALGKERRANSNLALAFAAEREAVGALELSQEETRAALVQEEQASAALSASNESLRLVASFEADRLGAVEPSRMGPHLRSNILEQVGETLSGESLEDFQAQLESIDFTAVAVEALRHGELEGAQTAIEISFEDRPELQAQLLTSLSRQMVAVGLYEDALEPTRRAVEMHALASGEEAEDTLRARLSLGTLQNKLGHFDEARQEFDSLIQLRRETAEPLDELLLSLRLARATVASTEGDGKRALAEYEELHPLFLESFGPDDNETLRLEVRMGGDLIAVGDYPAAVETLENVRAKSESTWGPRSINTLNLLTTLSSALQANRQPEEATAVGKQAHEGLVAVLGISHPDTLSAAKGVAQGLMNEGRVEEAKQILLSTAHAMDALYGENNIKAILQLANVNMARRMVGEFAESRESGALVIERARRALPAESPLLGMLLVDYGRSLWFNGSESKLAAEEILLEAYDILEASYGAKHEQTGIAADTLSVIYTELHESDPSAGYDVKAAEWTDRSNGHQVLMTKGTVEAAEKAISTAPESDQ